MPLAHKFANYQLGMLMNMFLSLLPNFAEVFLSETFWKQTSVESYRTNWLIETTCKRKQ